jgi:CBS-domain-containing membrane protein
LTWVNLIADAVVSTAVRAGDQALPERPEDTAMQAKDIMTVDLVTIGPEDTVADAARLMLDHRVSALPVVAQAGTMLGIVSEGDLLRRAETGTGRQRSWWLQLLIGNATLAQEYTRSHSKLVRDVMTREVFTMSPEASLREIADALESRRIKRVPIVGDGRLVGIVSRANLLQGVATRSPRPLVEVPREDRSIRKAVLAELGRQKWAGAIPANVIVEKGVVHLWGHALSKEERRAAAVAAETVPGVKEVKNHLVVASPPIMSMP